MIAAVALLRPAATDTIPHSPDPILERIAARAPARVVVNAGIDTTDVEALIDTVRSGRWTVAGPAAMVLGLRSERRAIAPIRTRLKDASIILASDLLFALYAADREEGRTAALETVATAGGSSPPTLGNVSSWAFEAAVAVLAALEDTSPFEVVADSAADGCYRCVGYLATLVDVDSTLYPAAENALVQALDASALSVADVVRRFHLQNTPAVRSVLVGVLDDPERRSEHLEAIMKLRGLPGRPLRGEPLANRLEAALMADTSGGWYVEPRLDRSASDTRFYHARVLELAAAFGEAPTIRLIERAATGEYGASIAEEAKATLARRRLDLRPKCGGAEASVFVSPGGLVRGGPDDGQLYGGRLRGTDGPDVMVGTDGPDQIAGFAGADTLCGLGGDDVLVGVDGGDTILGDEGTDEARGGRGNDACDAESEDSCERDPETE